MKKITTIIVSVIVIALITGFTLGQGKQDKGLYIAANVPLSGPLAMYGEAFRDGANLALKDLGRSDIQIDWQDNRGDLKTTFGIAQEQLLKKPAIYISGLKPQTQAITSLITEAKVPHFTWILDVKINETSDNNFRTWINFKEEANVFLNYVKGKDLRKVAITYVNLPSAVTEYQDIVIPGLKKQGVSDFFVEPFLLDKTDMKDVALKIKQYNPDLLIVNGFIPQMVNLIEELNVLGFDFEGKTIASIDMLDAARDLSPKVIEGIVVAAPEFIVNEPQKYIDWKNHFKAEYGYEPVYHQAYAYDMGLVIDKALKSGKDLTVALRETEIAGITGVVSFDSDQSSSAHMIPAVYRDGKLQEIR
jgi:branched-chain amino acid transport system substrate-binding protein